LHTLREERCAEEGLAPEEREREVIGDWRKLHIEELQDLFSSLIISFIRVVRSWRTR